MSLLCRSLVALSLVAAILVTSSAHAQTGEHPVDSHRRSLYFSVDGAVVADAFSGQCGRGNSPGLGLGPGGALLMRLRPWLVVQGDARVVMSTFDLWGCRADLIFAMIDSNTFETRPGAEFPSGTPRFPLATTALRVGLESPPGWPLLRATIGGGLAVGRRPAPIGAATLGFGTRGNGKRFYMEFEMNTSWVKATERRTRIRTSPTGEPVSLGTTATPVVIHGAGGALRLGIEMPLSHK